MWQQAVVKFFGRYGDKNTAQNALESTAGLKNDIGFFSGLQFPIMTRDGAECTGNERQSQTEIENQNAVREQEPFLIQPRQHIQDSHS